ncbi:MAG: glycosyltransferase family 2 protein [bacterium]|nr:glycosyltransferase family 2 protein [bacterium]
MDPAPGYGSKIINKKPFFSIGVPTYNRKDLLGQTLAALRSQTYKDFEIIVGNDFTTAPLEEKTFGFADQRVKFINHKKNIGELENMNSLLSQAQGRYFAWQFDDDPCAPTFLEEAHAALMKYDYPLCVFTSFALIYGSDWHKFRRKNRGQTKLYTGREFLRSYLEGRIRALGSCGFYDTEYLRNGGGAPRLTAGRMALHAEYLLLIKTGLLPKVVYIDAPLVTSRVHEDSWTCSNLDVELFKQAGLNLIHESILVLEQGALAADFAKNIVVLLEFVLSSVVVKIVMSSNKLSNREIQEYTLLLKKELDPLKGSPLYIEALAGLDQAQKSLPLYVAKARAKMILPQGCLKWIRLVHAAFSRYARKACGK